MPADGFFSQSRFLQDLDGATAGDQAYLEHSRAARRLNARHRALIEWNRHLIEGRRVLDLASHDGRWSWAALSAGAAHVTGIEGRGDLVEAARENLAAMGVGADRFEFVEGDLHARLRDLERGSFDTVLCFGFLYHTTQHFEVLRSIRLLDPTWFVVDTRVLRLESILEIYLGRPATEVEVALARRLDRACQLGRFWTEDASAHLSALRTEGQHTRTMSGSVNLQAYTKFCEVLGFTRPELYDWAASGAGGGHVPGDYQRGERVIFRVQRDAPSSR